MGEVVKFDGEPDPAEVERLERLAWRETERSQEVWLKAMALADRAAEARARAERAEAASRAAWARLDVLFGGADRYARHFTRKVERGMARQGA
jgi:hypothetical protein